MGCIIKMHVFDNEWINYLHCILWELGEVDEWVFHRIVYELSREGAVPVNGWRWFNNWPRSSEVDALIGFLRLLGVVDVVDGVIKAVKPPSIECNRLGITREKVKKILEEVRQLSSVSRIPG